MKLGNGGIKRIPLVEGSVIHFLKEDTTSGIYNVSEGTVIKVCKKTRKIMVKSNSSNDVWVNMGDIERIF